VSEFRMQYLFKMGNRFLVVCLDSAISISP
jgi:hypothetical protein